jgi:tRNA threonylcarbamoyladenosine biosynthesis protein TsaB
MRRSVRSEAGREDECSFVPAHSVIIAIETSQRAGGVALQTSGGETLVEALREPTRQDDDLMPAIDRVTKRAGIAPGDVQAVGVSIGPGGFTGLRIAIATAKMLAEALGVKLLAVPSALVAAESYEGGGRSMLVALASKRGGFWGTRLTRRDGQPGERWIIERAGLVDESTDSLAGVEVVLGDGHVPEWLRRMCERSSVPIVEPRFEALACLRCAAGSFAAGEFTDPLRFLPLYPREPEAVTIWNEREAGGRGGVQ